MTTVCTSPSRSDRRLSVKEGPERAGTLDFVEARGGDEVQGAIPQAGCDLALRSRVYNRAEERNLGSVGAGSGDGDDWTAHIRADEGDAFAVGGTKRLVIAFVVPGVGQACWQSSITQGCFDGCA